MSAKGAVPEWLFSGNVPAIAATRGLPWGGSAADPTQAVPISNGRRPVQTEAAEKALRSGRSATRPLSDIGVQPPIQESRRSYVGALSAGIGEVADSQLEDAPIR